MHEVHYTNLVVGGVYYTGVAYYVVLANDRLHITLYNLVAGSRSTLVAPYGSLFWLNMP